MIVFGKGACFHVSRARAKRYQWRYKKSEISSPLSIFTAGSSLVSADGLSGPGGTTMSNNVIIVVGDRIDSAWAEDLAEMGGGNCYV